MEIWPPGRNRIKTGRNAKRGLDADLLRDAFRCADFILNHLAVGEDLASAWSAVES